MNNFKDYGFEADFEGEIYTSYKSNDNQIFYNGAIWFKPKDDYHYMKPVSWTKKGEVIHHYFQENYLTSYSLKPIKNEWYENIDCNKPAHFIDLETNTLGLAHGYNMNGDYCLNDFWKNSLSCISNARPATKEEVLTLLVKE